MPAELQVGQYFLVRGTDTMFFYMTEDDYMIWTLIVSYFKQN